LKPLPCAKMEMRWKCLLSELCRIYQYVKTNSYSSSIIMFILRQHFI
jgi:hypothetical protein